MVDADEVVDVDLEPGLLSRLAPGSLDQRLPHLRLARGQVVPAARRLLRLPHEQVAAVLDDQVAAADDDVGQDRVIVAPLPAGS